MSHVRLIITNLTSLLLSDGLVVAQWMYRFYDFHSSTRQPQKEWGITVRLWIVVVLLHSDYGLIDFGCTC